MSIDNLQKTNFEDFTETHYRKLLKLAKGKYKFVGYEGCGVNERVILWRHDIDFSVHRALQLSKIESEEGIKATYFIHLHSEFYHWSEKTISNKLREIISLGHDIGLHFDPSYYGARMKSYGDMVKWLRWEKGLLEAEFEQEIKVFSFHNPDVGGDWLSYDDNKIADMINTYGKLFKNEYSYCSDSNGYWRYNRLYDELLQGLSDKLQVLTHPGWWTSKPLSPRERIQKCIDGRANNCGNTYDEILRVSGRENINGK